MRYDEIRVELSVGDKGRFNVTYSNPSFSSIMAHFVPPRGVSANALFDDWLSSFAEERSPALRQGLARRRRQAGERLFRALFGRAACHLRQKLLVLKMEASQGSPAALRIRLVIGDARGRGKSNASRLLPASSLPFELMIDPESERFLVLHRFVSLVRTLGMTEMPLPLRVSGVLRVLVVTAQPQGERALNWETEVARIRDALATRSDTTVEVLNNASFEQTHRRLRNGFHVFHFIGHGGLDPGSGQGFLLFEKDGKPDYALAEDLAYRLGDIPTLRLAVLNACHTGELAASSKGSAVASVATALSAHGVPAVVAMQIVISNDACIDFTGAFYSALREDPSVELAIADGRAQVPLSSPEWATPVLYLRGESSDLFDFKPEAEALAGSGVKPHELSLGIRTLVVSEKFPHLAAWAKRLEMTTEKLLALEESFEGRFIREQRFWGERVLPRLNRFLAQAVEQERPLALSLAAHGTVAFAAGYFFHGKSDTRISLVQVTAGEPLRWSEREGGAPVGDLWQEIEARPKDEGAQDVAVAVEITQTTSKAVEEYLAAGKLRVGRLIVARIAGEVGRTRIESGAHAYQLAWKLQEYLKDNTGNRSERRLHLFISAPNGFNFYFGQLARTLGALQLYEYDFEGTHHSTYEPSLDLPQATSD